MPLILQNSTKGDDNLWVNSSCMHCYSIFEPDGRAQPSITISAFADNVPFNEFDAIAPNSDIRFDFTASESADFICNVYIIDIDLQENVFKRLLKTSDCGSGIVDQLRIPISLFPKINYSLTYWPLETLQ